MRSPVPVSGPRGSLPGWPAQRTLMAWDRTALALIAHGALLMVRQPDEAGAARIVAAILSVGLAVAAALLGRRRAVQIAASDTTRRAPVPTKALIGLAAGTLALAMADVVTIVQL